MPRILIVDDEPAILNLLNKILVGQGYGTATASNGEMALQLLQTEKFDLMLSDMNMTPINGIELLHKAAAAYPDMGVIMLTAYATVTTAVEAMKEGAFDYIVKPFKFDELLLTIQRALEYHNAFSGNKNQTQIVPPERLDGIVAESAGMRKVCEMIERVAPASTTVLIYGENGAGKELVARALHRYSPRKDATFMTINCAGSAQLLEAALFGCVKGSFDAAAAAVPQTGLFETVRGGTLLLDEIGSMSLEIQSKLLRVLQDKKICKVGGTDYTAVDVRVIVASSEKLEPLTAQGRFREDLYHRLSVISMDIPPLRSRTEDILPLAGHIMRRLLGPEVTLPTISHEAQNILSSYNWPGNVRELENAIQHALAGAQNGSVSKDVLPAEIVNWVEAGIKSGAITSRDGQFKGQALKTFLQNKEKELRQRTTDNLSGGQGKPASELGASLASLYRKRSSE